MIDWLLFCKMLTHCTHPQIPNLRDEADGVSGTLYPEGGTMGTLILGPQGSGKTSYTADLIVERAIHSPEAAIFILDWSGSITDTLFEIVLSKPREIKEKLLNRIVYDEPGNPEWVVPLPEFSHLYGSTAEEQAIRVSRNLQKLSDHLIEKAPVLGGAALGEMAREVFRLLTAMTNERGESWQITEAKRLLVDPGLLKQAANQFGFRVPHAKWYLERELLGAAVKPHERELRTYMLRSVLGWIEPREIRARLGHARPGWTPREAIHKGLIVIVNGKQMINQEPAQHYIFTQVYSLIMEQMNKRHPGDPTNKPALLVLDEVFALIQIPGMAEEVGKIAPVYRSRKLELYVIIQALWQLDKDLRERIWSLGNVVCFGVLDFEEALTIAQQLFQYDPTLTKLPEKTPTQRAITELGPGQYTRFANWLQSLNHRECVIRRYLQESQRDVFIRHLPQTRDLSLTISRTELIEMKRILLRQRGLPVREALEAINARKLAAQAAKPKQV